MEIAIVFGGSSFEHEISIVSAITLKKVFKKHSTKFIFVDKNREFFLIEPENMKAKFFSTGEYKKSKTLILKSGGFFIQGLLGTKKVEFDVILNLIHGRDGEDGKLASMFEFFGIKFIGPRIEGSVISYNKLFTKMMAKELGINTIDYQLLKKNQERKIDLKYPLIIKPLRLGSSIGVSIVKEESELDYALDVAFEFDDEVLIENFIEGIKEYNLAGAKTTAWEFSILEEPQKDDFLDFEKKYLDFSRDEKVKEAVIDTSLKEEMEKIFKKIYDPLFLGSIIRCDFFVKDKKIYLNEINPIPGSMANYLFSDFEDMIERLSNTLPSEKIISIDYKYIDEIHSAKGKASQ
jgi:D-alanine-D-alanine ligase